MPGLEEHYGLGTELHLRNSSPEGHMAENIGNSPTANAAAAQSSTTTAVIRRMTYTEVLDGSPLSGLLFLVVFGVAVAQILDGIDFQSTSFALPLIVREFKLTPAFAGALGSTTNLGVMIGALLSGLLSDRFGRKPILQWILFTYSFGTFLSAVAWSYQFLLIARFIAGLGIGAEFPVAFALLAEYSPKRLRHILVPLGPLFYSVGWICCALLATVVIPKLGWRGIYWVGVTPALMIIYVRRFMPESVRYLLHKGRIKEAGEITRRIADRAGFADVELVPPEMAYAERKPSVAEQLHSLRQFTLTVIVLGFFYLAFHIQNVGFNAWLPSIFVKQGFTLLRSYAFTTFSLLVVPVGQLGAMWLQDKLPRKWAMLLLAGIASCFFFAVGLSFEMKYSITVIVACAVAYQFFSNAIVPILITLNAELFPTRVRGLGIGLVSAFSRTGSIVGPLAMGLFMSFGTAIHQIIYYFAVPLAIMAIVGAIFIKVDSRQKALEQVTGS